MKRVLVAAVLLLLAGCSSDGEARWQTAEVKDLDSGAVVVLGEVLPQTTTIVTLWSVWCVPCRQELPHLEKLKQSDGAISVVGVNIGDDEASTRLPTHPIHVIQVKPKIDINMMPIHTKVAGRPSINNTGTESTLSQMTAVELMPPICMAV